MPPPVIYPKDQRSPAARQRRRKVQLQAAGGRILKVALSADAARALDRLRLAHGVNATQAVELALMAAANRDE